MELLSCDRIQTHSWDIDAPIFVNLTIGTGEELYLCILNFFKNFLSLYVHGFWDNPNTPLPLSWRLSMLNIEKLTHVFRI
jgi:hypothetical protein